MSAPPDVTAGNVARYETEAGVAAYTRESGLRPLEDRLVREFLPVPPARLLDLGCGAGRTSGDLAERGYAVTAIDLAGALLEAARERHPSVDFRLMDATRLAFEPGSFDAAFFSYNGIDCIYPVASRVRCLQEVHRVLRPGGVFLLSSHNAVGAVFSGGYFYPTGYWNALRMLARQRGNPLLSEWYLRYSDEGGDQFLYSAPPGRTVAQLGAAGFEVLAVVGYARELPPGRVARRSQHVHFVARRP